MNSLATAIVLFALSPTLDLPTAAWQLVPPVEGELRTPQVTKTKAVLCIPGLYPHPFRPTRATKPESHPWFESRAPLLAALAADFDVYAIGYAQTVPVDCVANCTGFKTTIQSLRDAGYTELILVGHSAGGLIAHQFIERNPKSGVTKLIPVAVPYSGSELAEINIGVPRTQASYIRSLAPTPRQDVLRAAANFPSSVEYCAVVCKVTKLPNDILVGVESQWPAELRAQGLPATLVNANHFEILKSPQGVSTVVDLAKSKLVRWNADQTMQAASIINSNRADSAAMTSPKSERPLFKKLGKLINRNPAAPD